MPSPKEDLKDNEVGKQDYGQDIACSHKFDAERY